MKINDVLIKNWSPPGEEWWDMVKARPDEPLIEARLDLTLTYQEYKNLIHETQR